MPGVVVLSPVQTIPDPAKVIVHNNATLTASGSTIITGLGYSEWYLVVNLKNAPTGTAPTIQFKVEELDPVDLTSVIEVKQLGAVNTTAGIETFNIRELDGDTVKVSWTITGTTPSWSGVNVAWVGHASGNAVEGMQAVGEVADEPPVPIALIDQNGIIRNIRGDGLGNVGIAANIQTSYLPDPRHYVADPAPLISDPSDQLIIRGAVLTDEGTFRDDFSGSSLLTNLTGTLAFTNGSVVVTGTGTLFTTELDTFRYIRIGAHADSTMALVDEVISATSLTLATPYTGATASAAAVASYWVQAIPAGASITQGSSFLNLIASTTNGAVLSIMRDGDFIPGTVSAAMGVSQRIANQTSVVGLEDVLGSPQHSVTFVLDGTDNTKVKCRSTFATDSTQETLVTLPGSALSSAQNLYQININQRQASFFVNTVQVATHLLHLPGPYVPLQQVAYIKNTGVAGSSTTVTLDAVLFQNKDLLAVEDPLPIVGVAGGQPIIVQFGNPGGGTALPKLVNVNYNKSDGALVANVYKRVATYTTPPAFNGYLIKFVSFQNEAAVSRVVAETNMGQHNDNTNVFTAGAAYTSPQWVPTVQAEVTTAYAAGAGNVVLTVGYTNDAGTAGRSGTITIPKGSLIGSRWDLVLQGTDLGAMSIQSCTGTPTQVGISKILGLLQLALHQDQSTTAQTETIYAPGALTFPPSTAIGIEYAGGTVSKQRILDVLIQLVQ